MIRLPSRLVWSIPLIALAAAVPRVTAAPASADAPAANLNCTITVVTGVHPGVTPQFQHLAVTSNGLTGAATCTGTVGGQQVTGPGSFGIYIQLLSDCTMATGAGTFVLQVVTDSGLQTVAGRFAVDESAPVPNTGDMTGTSKIIAAVGNCSTIPITQVTSVLTVTIT